MDEVVASKHIPVLVAPDKGSRGTPRKGWTGGRCDWMRAVFKSEHGHERYKKRKQTPEPTFGNTKHNKGVTRFHHRGRIKVRTEWRLLMMTEIFGSRVGSVIRARSWSVGVAPDGGGRSADSWGRSPSKLLRSGYASARMGVQSQVAGPAAGILTPSPNATNGALCVNQARGVGYCF